MSKTIIDIRHEADDIIVLIEEDLGRRKRVISVSVNQDDFSTPAELKTLIETTLNTRSARFNQTKFNSLRNLIGQTLVEP